MQAFALSTPLHQHPSRQCRSHSVCPHRPLLSSISHARAILDQDDHATDSPLSPSMTATANVAEQGTTRENAPTVNTQIAAVRAQVEFWFSPSNLRRDWFLRKQMDSEGWLDPAVFLMFNKIKNLNADINDIILACKTSDELEVSLPSADSFGDDIAQTRVRRSPGLPSFNTDYDMEFERSFIVSGLPKDCTVDSLITIFSRFAPVTYAHIYRNKNFPDTPRALIIFSDAETASSVYQSFAQNVPEGCERMSLRKRIKPGDSEANRDDTRAPSILVCELNGLPDVWNWRALYRHLSVVFTDESSDRTNMKFLMYTDGSDHCYVSIHSNEYAMVTLDRMEKEGISLGGSMVSVRLLRDNDELAEYWRLAKEHEAIRKARKEEKMRTVDLGKRGLMQRNPTGVIVKVEGLSPGVKWRKLRAELGRMGKLVYLTRKENSEVCFARYGTAEEANDVVHMLTKEGGGTQVCGIYVDASILQGEDEIEYWINAEKVSKQKQAITRESTLEGARGGELSTEEERAE